MSLFKRNKKKEAALYNVADVAEGFNYWYYKLLNYCLGIYKYSGLPDSLPAREIAMNLILTGHAVIFKDAGGDLVTAKTVLFGFNKYYEPINATYGNVKMKSRTLNIGFDSEVIFLTRIQGNVFTQQAVDSGLATYIKRYARQLADMESSINIYAVNTRFTSFPVGSTDQVRQSLEQFYDRIALGDRAVITDNRILEAFRNVDIVGTRGQDRINDLLIARDKILSMFFREIGVKFVQEQKKAQLTEDEVVADEQLLLLNVRDMLDVQREGIEKVNKLFGTNIAVEISETFDRTTYDRREETSNDNTAD